MTAPGTLPDPSGAAASRGMPAAAGTQEALAKEHQRQQALLQVLWRQAGEASLAPLVLSPEAPLTQRGLQAYRANASASAERALASAHPTVLALVGEEAFGAVARRYWQACPPLRGDLAQLAEGFARHIESEPQLASLPYLGDIARLDALMAQAEAAADAGASPESLALLGQEEPDRLKLVLAPGSALLASRHPVVRIWQAHQGPEGDFDAARLALAAGEGDCALVWREGWKARVQALPPEQVAWTRALLDGLAVGPALECADAAFDFEGWLLQALRQQWLLGAARV